MSFKLKCTLIPQAEYTLDLSIPPVLMLLLLLIVWIRRRSEVGMLQSRRHSELSNRSEHGMH